MWIVRWPIVLALFVYVIVCAGLAAGAAVDRLGLAPFENPAWRRFSEYAVNTTWLQTALCAGGAVLLFVAAVRLIRRTQAFWAWLIGFAMIGARWGLMWQADGGPSVDLAQIGSELATKEGAQRLASSAGYDFGPIGVLLIIGLIILIVDAADRAHWARRSD
jgi:hypothetical protein